MISHPDGAASLGSPVLEMKPMKKHHKKYAILVICLLLAAGHLIADQNISVETVLAFTPEDPVKAVFIILLLYALKSATVFFPLIVLEIAVGHLFSPWTALGINFAGMIIILTIPYLIGKMAGIEAINKLVRKYPRFGDIIGKQQDNALFLCFFLRIISCLPGDVVTMYLGATRTPFWQNLLAGALGVLPGMILATFMGSNIQDPNSPAFWISAILMVVLAALSALLYYAYRRNLRKRADDDGQQAVPKS